MEKNHIKHVKVKKLWGVKNISTEFHNHINIFIGENGSSKTTFLNLIEATLLCDMNIFANIDFESIEIGLTDNSYIKVIRSNSDEILMLKYIFDNKIEYEIPCIELLMRSYRGYPSRYREVYSDIKNKLSQLINISWLSINRDNMAPLEYERGRDFMDRLRNMVDLKLEDLEQKLIVYQLQLESEANKSANKFKEDAISLMLYNDSVDIYKNEVIERVTSTDTNSMKKDLYKAFHTLGVAKDKSEQIQIHINKIKEVISKILEKKSITLNDVYVLSLINRTLSIIEISQIHEKQTSDIFSPMNKFWKCIKGFMPNKSFSLNNENDGKLRIALKEGDFKDTSINITSLSSGEKQLFILLTEVLLQKGTSHLFITDEPELSLHIEWQHKILSALLDLNPNTQIIVATHSPEIAGNFPENIINMKNITSYEQYGK